MSAQTTYNFFTPRGVAGGLYDISLHDVNSRRNEENDGVLEFGMGVVKGTTAGLQVKLPAAGAVAGNFEGVVINGFTTQHDLSGNISLANGATVGVLQKGRVWAKCIASLTLAYGDAVYLYITGDNKGLFSNASNASAILIPSAKFIGGYGTGNIAPIEYDLDAIKAAVDAIAASSNG